jgi:outer membrane protein insertion porin family
VRRAVYAAPASAEAAPDPAILLSLQKDNRYASMYRILKHIGELSKMKRLFACICIVLLLPLTAIAATIKSVDVEGNIFVSTKKILSIFALSAGQEYLPEQVSQGVRRLFQTKDFNDVAVHSRDEAGGVVLTVVVEEYPRVKELRVEGQHHLERSEIDAKLTLREGFFARPALMTKDILALEELYAEKGYNAATIRVRRIPLEEEHKVIVVYQIEEGEKVKVRNIDIIGNGVISSKELRDQMETKEDRWYRGGEFKPSVLEQDMERIKQLYADKGYLDAEVELARRIESDKGKKVDLYIGIDEGPQYRVGDITWSGNSVLEDEDVEQFIAIEKGEPFSVGEIEMMQLGISGKLWEKGYIWSRIIPERRVRKRTIDLDLRIVENQQATIKEIKISGNSKTFEHVIRRELRTYPGETFILGDVQRSIRDLFARGYFANFPRIDTEPLNEEGDMNLLIDVDEKQTGYFRMGAGFSQLSSLTGFFGISENNLFGRGKSVTFDWEFGRWRKNLNFRYSEPYFLGTRNALTVSVYSWVQDRVQQLYYTDRRTGFSVQLGRPFPLLDFTRANVSYRFEQVELTNFSSSYPEFGYLRGIDWPLNKSSVMVGFTRNSTDSPFHPTKGSITSLNAEYAGSILQGNVDYQRYTANMQWFRNLFWKFTFHLDMTAAVIDGYSRSDDIVDFEKFRLGGNRRYALRGYDFYEVVPEGNDPYVGGRFMTTLVQEILFPVSEQVYTLVFLDVGNVWNSFREADIFNVKRGLGLGIRLEMPGLGNLGFDYGYGYDKVGGPAWEPHFTFGTLF